MTSPAGACAPAGDPFLPSSSPVARFRPQQRSRCALRSRRLPSCCFLRCDRRFRLPGCPVPLPQPPDRLPEGLLPGVKITLLPSPLPPREPGWPSAPRDRHCWLPRLAAPFLGFRLACAVRYEGHFAPHVCAGQEVFSVPTGLSAGKGAYPQIFLVHPPFTHRLYTGGRSATRVRR